MLDLCFHKCGDLCKSLLPVRQTKIPVFQLVGVDLSLRVQRDNILAVFVRTMTDSQHMHTIGNQCLCKWNLVRSLVRFN